MSIKVLAGILGVCVLGLGTLAVEQTTISTSFSFGCSPAPVVSEVPPLPPEPASPALDPQALALR